LTVNGKSINLENIPSPQTVWELLQFLQLNPNTVAIERNGELLEKNLWQNCSLHETDQIEIIKFVGGG
jgi:sulfur carrier protein